MSILTDALQAYNLRAFDNIDAPELIASVVGVPGTQTYEYCATFRTLVGETEASATVTVTTGANPLTTDNKVLLRCMIIPAAARAIRYFKKEGLLWNLLGEVEIGTGSPINQLYDVGQATSLDVHPPVVNDSGRPNWYAVAPKPGRYFQRMELVDLIALVHRAIADLAAMVHRNGDIIEGGVESLVSGTTWAFSALKVFVDGLYVRVPAGQVTLTGTGTEKVGVIITPRFETYEDDSKLRNLDEGIPDEAYDAPGADRLTFDVQWVVDNPAAVPIREFVDNQVKLAVFRPERTEMQRAIADAVFDISGHCVMEPFGLEVVDHPSNPAKLGLKIHKGKARPNGWRVATEGTQTIEFDKARATATKNAGSCGAFSMPGGSVVTANQEPFDVDGLYVSIYIGIGNPHNVALAGNELSASAVGTQICDAINAYPTSDDLISFVVADGYLQLRAADGKSLYVGAIADDAYTELGLTAGTYSPLGTRIYEVNESYIKSVTDISYESSVVETITHNGTSHIDPLAYKDVTDILGASLTLADAHDGKWDYQEGVDFIRDGNSISFAGMGGSEPVGGSTYYVAHKYRRNAVKGSRILCRVTDAAIVKGAQYGADALIIGGGTVTKVSNGDPVTGLSGAILDAVRIVRVNNSPAQSTSEYNIFALLKNSTGLAHAQSEIDWSAAGLQGSGANGQPNTGATYYVTLEFWQHAVEGDLITADCYDLYDEIEHFSVLHLRDCVDFRTVGSVLPCPDDAPVLDYEYYLSRVDKLVLNDQGNFSLIAGAPAKVPPVPSDQVSVLSLAIVRLQPYTYNRREATVVSSQPVVISQVGLRRMMERLERAEYMATLQSLDNEVKGNPAAVDNRGIFTDALTGWGRVDLQFDRNGIKHTVALDRLNRTLRLPATVQPKSLEVEIESCTHVRRAGNILCLDYQPVVFDEQLMAAIRINAAPDWVYEDYVGAMRLNPFCDVFLAEDQLPTINVDFDENLAGLLGGQPATEVSGVTWGQWRTTGTVTNASGTTTLQERVGTQTTTIPGSITVDMGDRVVDLSLVQMLRTTDENGDPLVIHVAVDNLAPNQDHAVMIANIAVDFTYDNTVDHPRGAQGTHTVGGKTTVCTDNSGRLTGSFEMPAGVPNATTQVTVFHWNVPTHSISVGTFFGQGLMQTKQATTIGIPSTTVATTTVTDTQSLFTPVTPPAEPIDPESFVWMYWVEPRSEPLAQSTLIPGETTYWAQVELFFAAKSATMPFTVQAREMINGQPGPQVLASCTLEPDEIAVSADSSVGTVFTFPNVSGYNPGIEVCFVTLPGMSLDFELWAAELGAFDLLTGQIIGPPLAQGTLFHGPNNRTWEAWTKRALKYRLYKSNFENNCQVVFRAVSGIEAGLIATAVEEFISPGTRVVWSYCVTGTADWIPFHPRIDFSLESVITGVQLRIDVTSLGGNYQILEQIAGILFLLHAESANYVGNDHVFADPLNLPNKIVATLELAADGTNGQGAQTNITPKYSIDDGETWVELQPSPGYVPVSVEGNFFIHQFETPDGATVEAASNTTPITVTATGHPYQEDQVLVFASVTGNTAANGRRRVRDVTANTMDLYDEDTGAAIAGNGAYSGGGTIELAEFSRMRPNILFETTNRARSPEVKDHVGFICSKV